MNIELAKIFYEIANFLEMEGVPFKPRSYSRVARTLESLSEDVSAVYEREGVKGLNKIPGVGVSIAEKIEEYIKTGKVASLEELKKKSPIDIEALSAVEGVGPKTMRLLYEKLKVKTLQELERAAKTGKVRKVVGLGVKTEANILRGIEFLKKSKGRFLLGTILPMSREFETRLKKIPGVSKVITAGSIRRMQETVGDIDILVAAKNPKAVADFFVSMPEVLAVYGKGPTKTSVRLKYGIDADCRVIPASSYGAALQYFTGDKDHNVELRKIAISKGLKLNEYGLYKGKRRIAGKTEQEVYEALGMLWMPPEIRTSSGEIKAARQGKIPHLLELKDIRGDLQIQTNWTDGVDSIEEMAKEAIHLGYEYIAITDHTVSLRIAGGLDEKQLLKQMREIDRLNSKLSTHNSKLRIFKSAEVNILKDGSLDIKEEVLKKLDFVSAAVHSHIKMPKSEMTKRVLRALEHPLLRILLHPTDRLVGAREPLELDLDAVFKQAATHKKILEINGYPERLDLRDHDIRRAKEYGLKFVVSTDAHAVHHMKFMEFGVAQARRGWAEKKDIVNTLPLKDFLKAIQ
jgi:DNA polymerase (family 10)